MLARGVSGFELGEFAGAEPFSLAAVFACVLWEIDEVVDHEVWAVAALIEDVPAGW